MKGRKAMATTKQVTSGRASEAELKKAMTMIHGVNKIIEAQAAVVSVPPTRLADDAGYLKAVSQRDRVRDQVNELNAELRELQNQSDAMHANAKSYEKARAAEFLDSMDTDGAIATKTLDDLAAEHGKLQRRLPLLKAALREADDRVTKEASRVRKVVSAAGKREAGLLSLVDLASAALCGRVASMIADRHYSLIEAELVGLQFCGVGRMNLEPRNQFSTLNVNSADRVSLGINTKKEVEEAIDG